MKILKKRVKVGEDFDLPVGHRIAFIKTINKTLDEEGNIVEEEIEVYHYLPP